MRKGNFGCGEFKKKGYLNVDWNDKVKPDVVMDLSKFPYQFKDEEFDVIETSHLLEHMDDPFRAMSEFRRIVKKGGEIIITVPHFSRGFTHPEHKRAFDVSFPLYFNARFKGGYRGFELEIRKIRLRWFCQPYLKKTVLPMPVFYGAYFLGKILDFFANLSPYFCSRFWCFLVGGFEEIEFHFVRP